MITILPHAPQPQIMADDDNDDGLIFKLIICLIAAASAAVAVTIYHCITARYMRPPPSRQWSAPPEISVSMENSVAELLPCRKYGKDEGVVGVGVGCAICLSEFEEGEEVRTLPECCHSFHVACIDMWLYSHWSCPMCRSVVEVLAPSSSPTLMHLLHPTNTTHPSQIIL